MKKLRNKKARIIGELHFAPEKEYHFTVVTEDPADMRIYKTLDDLCKEWEDYEEPETYYYISDLGKIESLTNDYGQNLPEEIWHKAIKCRKEIDNCFETKEEAEKSVEKLKALRRLRVKGFKFKDWYYDIDKGTTYIQILAETREDVKSSDLYLLFGGEE